MREPKIRPGFAPSVLTAVLAAALLAAGPTAAGSGRQIADDPVAAALDHLRSEADRLGLSAADLESLELTDRVVSEHNGVTHLYFRQSFDGLAVAGAEAAVHVGPDGSIVHLSERLVRDLRGAVSPALSNLSAEQAVGRAAESLGLAADAPLELITNLGGASRAVELRSEALSRREIPVRQQLLALPSGAVRRVWTTEIEPPRGASYWTVSVDAATGEVLAQDDLVAHDTYEVFAIPTESPSHGPRTIEVNVADPAASPFGWHDTNGAAGAEFTDTRGNNVFAQEDQDANNTGGFRPDGGPTLDFQFPLDLGLEPSGYQPAAITNLFYWNNVLHDIHHHYGFDEASGNFQQNNYTGATGGGDAVRADAQDGSGVNNANFLTLPDGSPPRMQMFVWGDHVVEVNSPAGIAGKYLAGFAQFGSPLNMTGITDDLVLADDGVGATADACQALVNPGQIAGNIAVVDRGTCGFSIKVKNAQNAGAVGAVVVNNQGDDVLNMSGTDPTIFIPSVFIGQTDGTTIKGALPGVNATLKVEGLTVPNRDSDLDGGIIAHEYGHGVSNRLTGGKSAAGCLVQNQSRGMGEGWSDFWALAFTAETGDQATDPRGIGTYVLFEPPNGPGIRQFPYTTDLVVNPHTYADIGSVAVPHGVGSVWAAMLWEVYWNLVGDDGFDADVYSGSGGNNTALQLVMDGLKLQGCHPTFVAARDAILAADKATYENANHCSIWQGFAKRGLGASATPGNNPNDLTNIAEAFDLPAGCFCDATQSGTWKHPTLAASGTAYGNFLDSTGTKAFGLRSVLVQTGGTGGTIVGGLSDSTAPSPDWDVQGTWKLASPTALGRFSADIFDPGTGEKVGSITGRFDPNFTGPGPGTFSGTWELCF